MDACTDCMAFEFQPENVSPFYDDFKAFVKPQWPFISQMIYVCYRVVVAILIIVWVAIDFFEEGAKFYADNFAVWFIFATNWGFLLLAVSAVLRAFAAIWYFVEFRKGDSDRIRNPNSISIMVLWIVYNIAANSALVVTISYWTFLTAFDTSGFLQTHMSQLKHTLNSAYILFDLLISAMPIRIFHLIYPMFVGAVYTVFNALYFINDGLGPDGKPYAYYAMDWRNPVQSAVTCSVGFILTTVVQAILYGIYRLRGKVFHAFYEAPCDVDDGHHPQQMEEELDCVGHDKIEGEEVDSILPERRERSPTYNAVGQSEDFEMIDESSQDS